MEAVLAKALPPGERIGESWELSDHFNDVSIVRNGPLEGSRLRDIMRESPKELLGESLAARLYKEFPLLIKFIDAAEKLSIQVHPDDEYAAKDGLGESGKNEAWYIVSAEKGAGLVSGLAAGTTKKEFRRLLGEGGAEKCLNLASVKAGDVIHMAAGTVHALGAGILLCEVQQSSDATYRIWDWQRPGDDGKPRPLHVEKALDVIDFSRGPVPPAAPEAAVEADGCRRQVLDRCPYFVIERIDCRGKCAPAGAADRFSIFICIAGSGSIVAQGERYPYSLGDVTLLPASCGGISVEPLTESTMLRTWIP